MSFASSLKTGKGNPMKTFNIYVKIGDNQFNGYFEAKDENEAMMKALCRFSKENNCQADDVIITYCEETTKFMYARA